MSEPFFLIRDGGAPANKLMDNRTGEQTVAAFKAKAIASG